MRRTYSPANARLFVGETSEFHARLPSPLLPRTQLTKDSPSLPFRRFRPPELPAKLSSLLVEPIVNRIYFIIFPSISYFSLSFFSLFKISRKDTRERRKHRDSISLFRTEIEILFYSKRRKNCGLNRDESFSLSTNCIPCLRG